MEKKGLKEGTVPTMEGTVQKRGKSRREDGIATAVDFLLANARLVLGIGGAAVLGIATLAVKRVRRSSPKNKDEKTDQKSISETWEELSLTGASPKLLKRGLENSVNKSLPAVIKIEKEDCSASSMAEMPKLEIRRVPLCVTLQEKLLHYYQSHVTLSESDVTQAKQKALDVCMEIQAFLRSKQPEMPLGEMSLGGSLFDDLQVVSADHACLLVPLLIEEKFWYFVPGEETILNTPQFWMVRRTNLEYFGRGSSYWDKFIVGGYLSSNAVNESLHKLVMGSMNWPALGSMLECTIRQVMGSQELKLEIQQEQSQLFIDILPIIRFEETVLTSQPESKGNFENLWCRSFYTDEATKLRDLDASDSGLRLCCLKILKAVCKDQPSLRRVTGGHLVNVILHLSDTELDWSEAALADRFLQVITEVTGYLEQGFLPSYFNSAVNLLSELSAEEIDEIGYTFYCALSNPDMLLQRAV
ncbi:mitochondrial dynamics protein MID49 [Huso huso]|uniref:Mitochondrial dynamics protein MID49 n=1 Tax=Huso huso TaxID=61971 RepID=A0ABR0YUD4_HUSHU